jgi:hypothetical protein
MSRSGILRIAFLVVVVAVVSASVASAQAGPYQFYSVTPCRIIDTRSPSAPLSVNVVRNIKVTGGTCGVPATAKAATLNVTFVGPTRAGYISIWPYNTGQPVVSTVNANAGEPAIANGAIVPLTSDPSFNISVIFGSNGPGSANLILDVTGYFQ